MANNTSSNDSPNVNWSNSDATSKPKKVTVGFALPNSCAASSCGSSGSSEIKTHSQIIKSVPIDIDDGRTVSGDAMDVFQMSPLSRTALQYSLGNSVDNASNTSFASSAFTSVTAASQKSTAARKGSIDESSNKQSTDQSKERTKNTHCNKKHDSAKNAHFPTEATNSNQKNAQQVTSGSVQSLKQLQPNQSQASKKPEGSAIVASQTPGGILYDDPKRRSRIEKSQIIPRAQVQKLVPLFSHLPQYEKEVLYGMSLKYAKEAIHPAIVKLGLQYSENAILGANNRCIAMLEAFKQVIRDYKTPLNATLNRHLDAYLKPLINYLVQFRPMATSMGNAIRYLKCKISEIPPDMAEDQSKEGLIDTIDLYIQNRIKLADELIAEQGNAKIHNGDVILTYAHSSTVLHLLRKAAKQGKVFRVIVVDSRPLFEGKKLLAELVESGIKCSYALLTSLGYVVKEATKVFIGAHCIFSNGNLMSRVGTALVAMIAKEANVPVCAVCETYKFSERVQIDSVVYNEIGDPDHLINASASIPSAPKVEVLADWRDISALKLLNIMYDVTPAKFITAVITEIGMIPCTSIPVVLREYRPFST